MSEKMSKDGRPLAATGHLFLKAKDFRAAAERLKAVGVRSIVDGKNVAVLELRGGTHIVVRQNDVDELHEAAFDLMYDDLDAAHTMFAAAGFEVSDIEVGRIHRGFNATAPERFVIRVLDSHADDRVV